MQTGRRRQSLARIFSPKTPPLVPPSFPPTPPLFDCLPTHLVRPPAPVRGPSVRRRPLRRPNRRSLLLPSVLKPSRPGYTARRAASRPGCRLAGGTFRPPLTELQLWLYYGFLFLWECKPSAQGTRNGRRWLFTSPVQPKSE